MCALILNLRCVRASLVAYNSPFVCTSGSLPVFAFLTVFHMQCSARNTFICTCAIEPDCQAKISRDIGSKAPITALNTIRNDILSIENRWKVIVESVKSGRNVRYRYQDPEFSIFNSPLNEFEIEQLTQAVSVLRRFEGMPGSKCFQQIFP